VGFVLEVSVIEIGAQFMAFPRACDTLITSCFLVNNYLTTATAKIRTVAGEGVPSKNDEWIQAYDVGRNFDDVAQRRYTMLWGVVRSKLNKDGVCFFCG
jgi:hypothetical protein